MSLEIRLLGVVEVLLDGTPAALGGPRQRRLLGYLGLSPGVVRSMDSISAAVWPDGDVPDDPRQALRTYTSRLRASLGEDLVSARQGGYVLTVTPVTIDVGRVEALVREAAEPGCPRERAVVLLSEALGLWRGNALEGFESEEWARGPALRLAELRARAHDDRAEALLALGRPADAVGDLEAAAADSPLRERTHALLMTALHRCGRQAEALRVFQQYRQRLATDLGLEPGGDLRKLEADIAADGYGSSSGPPDGGRPLRGYILGDRIGDGSFAVVYRATQPSVGRDVAIKVIRADLANRPEFIRRFEFEAHLVARLEHPHIVPLYDYWREPGSAYLVMRLLRGGSLERQIANHPLSADQAVRLAEQVGGALSTAHRAGIVHRDVKPANVFRDDDGNFFLGDFGIALETAAPVASIDSLSIGSPAYASPEQLRREPVGPTADVHGLAITLFESLTGQLPFPDAHTQAELLRRQLNDPLPSAAAIRPDLPSEIDHILATASAKDAASRYPSMDAFVGAFTSALQGIPAPSRTGTATVVGDLRNPYKGLRAFQEADAADFHGRQRLVDRLLAGLTGKQPAARLRIVVGPSGSGKSSLVRAGMIPALRAGALPGSSDWFITTMTPGAHPFEELERALQRIAVTTPAGLAPSMAADRRGIARAVKQACPVEDGEVLVVIDQFEELFTLCTDDLVRQQFISGLVDAVVDPKSPLRVVATLRADFYDRPLRYPELAALIGESAITVAPLSGDELDRAITEPAHRVGAMFEPGLVARIVADVLDQPGALPLMQYTLSELFDHHVSGVMTVREYERLGGLSGTLARRADQLFIDSTEAEQGAAHRVFTRLVTLGEGTEDTRRRVRRSEFDLGTDADAAVDAVIDAYGSARLLAFDRDPVTREPTVEVAHEALIREWPRLRAWLDEDRDGLRVHRHVTEAARAWDASGRDAGELYRGGRLEVATSWSDNHRHELNASEAAFLEASVEQRELAELADRRSRRRLQRSLIGVAVVAVVALLTGLIAFQQRRDAVDAKDRASTEAADADAQREAATAAAAEADAQREAATAAAAEADAQREAATAAAADAEAQRQAATDERDQARVDRLVAESGAQLDSHLDLSMLLAVEAWKRDSSPSTSGAMLGALTHQVSAELPATGEILGDETTVRRSTSRLLGFIALPYTYVGRVDLSADGSVAAVAVNDADGTPYVAVFDTRTRRMVTSVPTGTAPFVPISAYTPTFDFDLSPDGGRILVVREGGVDIVDIATDARTTFAMEAVAEPAVLPHAAFTADSRYIVVRDHDGRLSMRDGATTEPVDVALPARANTGRLLVTPDGLLVVFDSDPEPTLVVWDVTAGQLVRRVVLERPSSWPDFPWEPVLTPDLRLLVGFTPIVPMHVWDAETGARLPPVPVPAGRMVAVDPVDPSLLVFGSPNGQIVTYDMSTGRVLGSPLRERGSRIQGMAVAAGAGIMATVADDRLLTLWGDNAGPGLIDTPLGSDLSHPVFGGELLVVETGDGRNAEIRRADQPDVAGVPIAKPAGPDHFYAATEPAADAPVVLALTYGPEGGDPAWSLVVVDGATGALKWQFYDPDWNAWWARISRDGRLVAVLGDFDVRIFDVTSGEELPRIEIDDGTASDFAFSPDSRYLYVATFAGIRRYDLSVPGDFVETTEKVASRAVAVIAGSSHVVADAGLGRGLARYDMDTGAVVATGPSLDGSNISFVIASPDGSLVASFHFFSGNVAIFDAATLQVIGVIPTQASRIGGPGFTPDGNLAFDSVTGVASVWDLDPEHWATEACHAAGRNLTQAEWERYIGVDEPYAATCDEWRPG